MDVNQLRLANLIALQGELTREQLADKLGMTYTQVGHWFMDPERGGHRNIGSTIARRIEGRFGKPHGWLDQAHLAVEESPAHYAAMRDVPIIGHVIANPVEDGYFDDMGFPPGGGEGNVPWATRDRHAYAVRVKGDSMQPRFRAGEIVIVEPGAAVVPGDDVVVRAVSGRKMVKRLLFQRGNELTLGSVNDRHPPLTISLEEIESIHHIAGSVQRGTSTKD